jgi:phosphoribosylanthranilate isomerase
MHPTTRSRVKICCIKNLDEAWLAIEAGASAIGLVSAMPSGPGVINEEAIAAISSKVPPGISTFLLTCLTSTEAIIQQHRFCRTTTIQLCDYLQPGDYAELRAALPGIRLVQVVHVLTEKDVAYAESVAPDVDAVLLDSGNPGLAVKELGGTGRIHNWNLSRQIRERLPIPVFLAGGLHAGNVAEAIATVGPFGVDVCSGVRGGGDLDPEKLKAFIAAVQP